jgi:hypothetical protein
LIAGIKNHPQVVPAKRITLLIQSEKEFKHRSPHLIHEVEVFSFRVFSVFSHQACFGMFTNHVFRFGFHRRRWTSLGLIFGQLTKLVKLWAAIRRIELQKVFY